MILPTLYSRTSTGAIQQWIIETHGNKFRTISGQIEGAKVESGWTICEGKNVGKKNATTGDSQAESEAQARWDKKARMGYTPDMKNIDFCMGYVEPMTAKKLLDRLKKIDWKKGVLVQNKFNGHRCVARMENGKVVLRTRTGKLYSPVTGHIAEDLKKWFDKAPDSVLDGELFNNDLRTKLNEISSLLRKGDDATPADIAAARGLIRFYIYDGYRSETDDLGADIDYIDRKAWLDKMIPANTKYCSVVKTDKAFSLEEVNVIYFAYLADEQEGAIIRIPNSPYESKRSDYLLKYKPVDDDECKVKKLHEGTGNWAGTAKTATIEWKGKTFDATFMGSLAQGAHRLAHPEEWEGKSGITFLYNGLTGLGIPNYARIDPDNCFGGEK
jgi:ATP-dependent DNA ligase